MFDVHLTPGVTNILLLLVFVGLVVTAFYILRYFYCPRSAREWQRLLTDKEAKMKLRERKRRLDAIRSRRPGAILPGIPTSMRDFALEPLIRNGKFKAAKHYIMEQIRKHRDTPEGNGRMKIYVKYLELIEGSS